MVDLTDYPFLSVPVYHQQGLSDTPKLYTRLAIAEKLVELQHTKNISGHPSKQS